MEEVYWVSSEDGRITISYFMLSGSQWYDNAGNQLTVPASVDPISYFQTLISTNNALTYQIVRLENTWNEYYPRIHRPYLIGWGTGSEPENSIDIPKAKHSPGMGIDPYPVDDAHFANSITHLRALTQDLKDIFLCIEPIDAQVPSGHNNLSSFGHRSRNLLMIACTEIEAQWRGVLEKNGYVFPTRPSTRDYVKLLGPLRLAEYEVSFPFYPGITAIRPFDSWSQSNPTKSLGWYDSYNETKHDRERQFSRGSVLNAISAIAACAVMLIAQYGKRAAWKDEIGNFFEFDRWPEWPIEEHYIRDIARGNTHRLKRFSF